jgi:hypothetical protein
MHFRRNHVFWKKDSFLCKTHSPLTSLYYRKYTLEKEEEKDITYKKVSKANQPPWKNMVETKGKAQ